MMDEVKSTESNQASSLNDGSLERDTFVDTFWSLYQESGVQQAANYFRQEVNGNMAITQALIPFLVEAGYARDIDMIKAVEEMQAIALENVDADGTTDDGGELHTDSSDAPVVNEDEAESADAGATDREDTSQ